MGRVYDALKRAGAADSEVRAPRVYESAPRGEIRTHHIVPSGTEIEEQLFSASSTRNRAEAAVKSSAFTAHTADASDGMALPERPAPRAVGATLNAARPARASGLVSYDVDAARVEPHLIAITQPRSAYCEQFRSLRTRILQAGERMQMRAFVITSAGVGEGKTLTALNLAWLLAQTEGMRALIIDSDLRQPCATEYLGIDAPVGLSDVLGGSVKVEDAIVRLNPAGLYLLPGGKARDDVAELLSGPSYARLLTDVRRMFDYIIIDAPPLGIFTDANVLMNRADGALLVVRSGKTRYSMVDKLLEQIPREKLLGVVLNRVDERFDETAYYYQRSYYNRDRALTTAKTQELPGERQEEVAAVN